MEMRIQIQSRRNDARGTIANANSGIYRVLLLLFVERLSQSQPIGPQKQVRRREPAGPTKRNKPIVVVGFVKCTQRKYGTKQQVLSC